MAVRTSIARPRTPLPPRSVILGPPPGAPPTPLLPRRIIIATPPPALQTPAPVPVPPPLLTNRRAPLHRDAPAPAPASLPVPAPAAAPGFRSSPDEPGFAVSPDAPPTSGAHGEIVTATLLPGAKVSSGWQALSPVVKLALAAGVIYLGYRLYRKFA